MGQCFLLIISYRSNHLDKKNMQFICNFHHSVFFNSTNELRSGKEPLLSAWDYSVTEDIKQSSCAEKDVSIYIIHWYGSVAKSCPTLCNPMNRSTPGLPVHHQLPEFTQTHVHWVDDAIQPSHPLSSPSLPAFNLFQHPGLFKWVSSSHQVA